MQNLLIVRHAESFHGRLTHNGEEQLQALARAVYELNGDMRVYVLVSSARKARGNAFDLAYHHGGTHFKIRVEQMLEVEGVPTNDELAAVLQELKSDEYVDYPLVVVITHQDMAEGLVTLFVEELTGRRFTRTVGFGFGTAVLVDLQNKRVCHWPSKEEIREPDELPSMAPGELEKQMREAIKELYGG